MIYLLLRNYEMKEEIYCFVILMIAKYGRLCIIIGRNFAYHGTRTKIESP
jgi:hypothetical protein